jgi:hypothetical protein
MLVPLAPTLLYVLALHFITSFVLVLVAKNLVSDTTNRRENSLSPTKK